MTKILRQTAKYELIKGESFMDGCYAAIDKETNKQSYWNTGSEGQEWAHTLMALDDEKFDEFCQDAIKIS